MLYDTNGMGEPDPKPTLDEMLREAEHTERICEMTDEYEPVHQFFGLTYSNYLVIPRTLLEQMPVKWQQAFVFLLGQADEYFEGIPEVRYSVQARDEETGRFIQDPLAEYRHPTRLQPKADVKVDVPVFAGRLAGYIRNLVSQINKHILTRRASDED